MPEGGNALCAACGDVAYQRNSERGVDRENAFKQCLYSWILGNPTP